MAINPKYLDLEWIVIQCCSNQSELGVFQKYCSCEDCTNLFWAQIFLLEYLETSPYEFKKFLLLKLANFCDVLKGTCLCLTFLEMLIYDFDK